MGKVFVCYGLFVVVLIVIVMIGEGSLVMWVIFLVGFCNLIMFLIIFSFVFYGLGKYILKGLGILCLVIVGGVIILLL